MIDTNTRLITSGCSNTKHCWNTWADFLGQEFTESINVGTGGADNAYIARSVISRAKAGYSVVILWSSYDRWSLYKDEIVPRNDNPGNHWLHRGSMSVDKVLFTNYYHRVERFQTTMDYIQLVDLHSQVNGYTAYHFSAFPIFKAERGQDVDPRILKIYNRYTIKNNFLTELSLIDYQSDTDQQFVIHHKYAKEGDSHPTPAVQWQWLNKIMAPKLGITLKATTENDVSKEQTNILNGIVK
jgi:hypothetical protein